jgi:WS/DGAT/MGAT family acyltransferase
MWLVEGLSDGRVGLVEKIHHALVDGISGVDVATATMDTVRETQHLDGGAWVPEPAPGLAALIRDAAGAAAAAPARSVISRLRSPADAIARAVAAIDGLTAAPLGDVIAPGGSLNQPIGTTRLLEAVSLPLAEAKAVARAAGDGVKVNDVLLAAVSGGLRRLFEERAQPTTGRRPHALVPVSLRRDHQRLGLGNLVSSFIVPLPIDVTDGAERLRVVAATTARLKQRRQAATTAAALGALDAIPPLLWSTLTPIVHRQPLVNVVVTNVPGPPVPLYLLGAALERTVPIVPLAGNLDVSIGIVSYAGDVSFGLYADEQTCGDVAVLAEGIEKSFIELKAEVQ